MTFTSDTLATNAALFRYFAGSQWAVVDEVTLPGQLKSRRIDLLCLRPAARAPERFDLTAVEVKTSRADFQGDLRDPAKQAGWREFASRHFYACPAGLIRPEETPPGSGLLYVHLDRHGQDAVERIFAAPDTGPRTLPAWLAHTVALRACWSEARLKGWLPRQNGDSRDPLALQVELEQLRERVLKLERTAELASTNAQAWRAAATAAEGLPCAVCGSPVRPQRVREGVFTAWVHVDEMDTAVCDLIRLNQQRKRDQPPPAVHPVDLEVPADL